MKGCRVKKKGRWTRRLMRKTSRFVTNKKEVEYDKRRG